MSHRYRSGSKLHDGSVTVESAVVVDLPGGRRHIENRGLRIKFTKHSIDLDHLRMSNNWTQEQFDAAVAKMDWLCDSGQGRADGRGFYRDDTPTSSFEAANKGTKLGCTAFWAEGDGVRVCGEETVEGTFCKTHATKSEAAVNVAAASSSSGD